MKKFIRTVSILSIFFMPAIAAFEFILIHYESFSEMWLLITMYASLAFGYYLARLSCNGGDGRGQNRPNM
jgi:hypothetical protein